MNRGDALRSGPVPNALALGERPAETVAAAVEASGGLAWLPEVVGEVVVATADVGARSPGLVAARAVAERVAARGGRARLVAPGRLPLGALPLVGDRDRWRAVDIAGSGARVERVPVRRELAEAAALIGVGSIGGPASAGPLAIGLWRRFVHPRFAIAARLGGDRAPLLADLAVPFRPRLLVLAGTWRSQVVAVATADLIAAELTGLAIRLGAIEDPADRPRPWEDPLVQRATELDLGVRHPSSLDLRAVWTGPSRSPAAGALRGLEDVIAEALGIR